MCDPERMAVRHARAGADPSFAQIRAVHAALRTA